MNFKICELSLVCVRKDASEDSLMTSQLLFGEIVMVLTVHESWYYIRSIIDHHEGWVIAAQLKDFELEKANLKANYCLDLVNIITVENENIPVLIGSNLFQYDGMSFKHGVKKFFYNGSIVNPEKTDPNSKLAQKLVLKYLNSPYLFGGKSPFGIDASALVQMVYRLMGIYIPRYHFEQVKNGENVEFYTNAQLGDLVFFDDERGTIIHVGMLIGDGQIIHVHDKVRIDPIDMYGIIDANTQKYIYKSRIIKRLLPTEEHIPGVIVEKNNSDLAQTSIFES
jgi:hypothetical protein